MRTSNNQKSFSAILPSIRATDGWLSDREALFLYTAAKLVSSRGDIVEIGSWKGKSTLALASAIMGRKNQRVYAVDPHKGIIAHGEEKLQSSTLQAFKQNLQKANVSKAVVPIVATSNKARKTFVKPISLLFLDGLHDYAHTKEDYELWAPLVIPGGIIAFHDAYCGKAGVFNVCREVIMSHEYPAIGVVGSILYVTKGDHASWWKKMVFAIRKSLIVFGDTSFRLLSPFPHSIRLFLSHRFIKVLLYTNIDTCMAAMKNNSL